MPVIFFPVQINMLGFKVNTMEHNSSISFGSSIVTDLSVFTKSNTSTGAQNGDFPASFSLGALNDSDIFDATQSKGSVI
ncbi:hypothetical protein GFC01_02230 [Desulfofundulus thermobenzoicus]|uniref:Spore germination protein n=1 Tax=Desulfofundulus thermobenzoicus TaxID=29376 RepID=A0A6N7IMC4_9FIRM|nr:hypothetical protein [Desulfofundulus thermobenzoicus]MQL51101.1 hypothetical protein [Desulfofundulus thermobenzoicus]HHW42515.1 hypothetical protein [Desulfotomaculum sp.]